MSMSDEAGGRMTGANKRSDLLVVGDEFAPLEFHVTPEFSENYLHAVEDHHPRYTEGPGAIVHPALLIVFSNNTRSPSFSLDPGMAAIQTHELVEYHSPGRVGSTFRVTFEVVETYEKRGRPYQVVVAPVVDDSGTPIITRTTTYTYVGGPYPGIGS
jgi:hypothetical protein